MEVEGGVSYFEDTRKDPIVFALPLPTISSQIIYPSKGYNFSELVKLSNSEADSPLFLILSTNL